MKTHIALFILLITGTALMAQKTDKSSSADSLLNSLSTENKNEPIAIFKSSRMILSQTTETVKKKNLNFLVIHRFGDFAGKQGGGKLYFGLDDVADVYLGFEYGITNDLNIDIGRTTIGGLADLELKYAALHQTNNGSPFAITVLGEYAVRPYGFVPYPTYADRVSYMGQIMIAHQFAPGFALQLTPTYISNASSLMPAAEAQYVSILAMARIKISKHAGFIIDYGHPFSSYRNTNNSFYDALGFGFEVETGGHVFTMNVTNAKAIDEVNYLNNNQADYSQGQWRVGFTISRMFDFNHKKKSPEITEK